MGATDEKPARCAMLAHKPTGVAWWEGAVDDESLIAVPASAASRKHPGNCSPDAQSSWSHEPEFSVQFISQPFWSTPCLLRTTNPIGTRSLPALGRKGPAVWFHQTWISVSTVCLCFCSGNHQRKPFFFLLLLFLFLFIFFFLSFFFSPYLLSLMQKPGFPWSLRINSL